MKLRESGMPEETYWETLLNVPLILDRLGIDARLNDVCELGCGYGTFTIPVARRISGTLTTCDIEPDMVRRTLDRCRQAGLSNVACGLRDVMVDGFGVAANSQDACLMFNILHAEQPVALLAQAAGTVRVGGCVVAIHWRYDGTTPRGPSLDIRPRPEDVVRWGRQTGFLEAEGETIDLPPWHYGIRWKVNRRRVVRGAPAPEMAV
jgi:SAM-dependent methyltransferase